jgi:hypothetical protein
MAGGDEEIVFGKAGTSLENGGKRVFHKKNPTGFLARHGSRRKCFVPPLCSMRSSGRSY